MVSPISQWNMCQLTFSIYLKGRRKRIEQYEDALSVDMNLIQHTFFCHWEQGTEERAITICAASKHNFPYPLAKVSQLRSYNLTTQMNSPFSSSGREKGEFLWELSSHPIPTTLNSTKPLTFSPWTSIQQRTFKIERNLIFTNVTPSFCHCGCWGSKRWSNLSNQLIPASVTFTYEHWSSHLYYTFYHS